jgi:2-phosphosulfolactate phosphatase
VHLLPALVEPESLAGGVAIVIDQLRASSTIAAALTAGAMWVRPALTIEDARAWARQASRGMPAPPGVARVLLGGERGGVRIDGFDFGNSPAEYTRERVAGRGVSFTTTNGTGALLHAASASRVFVGCLANARAVAVAAVAEGRPVHVLCAGTHGLISAEDVLAAGAIVEKLLAAGISLAEDDSGLIAVEAWRRALAAGPVGIVGALRSSLGGRNLLALAMDEDIRWCAQVDTLNIVPEFDPGTGLITAARA